MDQTKTNPSDQTMGTQTAAIQIQNNTCFQPGGKIRLPVFQAILEKEASQLAMRTSLQNTS